MSVAIVQNKIKLIIYERPGMFEIADISLEIVSTSCNLFILKGIKTRTLMKRSKTQLNWLYSHPQR